MNKNYLEVEPKPPSPLAVFDNSFLKTGDNLEKG